MRSRAGGGFAVRRLQGVQAIRAALNTTTIKDATAANVLEKANMNKILEIMGQEDASNICVLSSEVKMTGAGAVTSVTLDMTNIVSDGVAESWRLTATEKRRACINLKRVMKI